MGQRLAHEVMLTIGSGIERSDWRVTGNRLCTAKQAQGQKNNNEGDVCHFRASTMVLAYLAQDETIEAVRQHRSKPRAEKFVCGTRLLYSRISIVCESRSLAEDMKDEKKTRA